MFLPTKVNILIRIAAVNNCKSEHSFWLIFKHTLFFGFVSQKNKTFYVISISNKSVIQFFSEYIINIITVFVLVDISSSDDSICIKWITVWNKVRPW